MLSHSPVLCCTMDCGLPGSSVHEIFKAVLLEWVAISYSRGSSRPRDWTRISYISPIGRQILYHWCHLRTTVRKASYVLIWLDKGVKRFQVQQVMVSGCEAKNNLISLTFGKGVTHTSLSCFITKDQIVCSNRSFSPEPMMCTPIKNSSRDSEERVSNCLEAPVNV